jgi:hypothetical protein
MNTVALQRYSTASPMHCHFLSLSWVCKFKVDTYLASLYFGTLIYNKVVLNKIVHLLNSEQSKRGWEPQESFSYIVMSQL